MKYRRATCVLVTPASIGPGGIEMNPEACAADRAHELQSDQVELKLIGVAGGGQICLALQSDQVELKYPYASLPVQYVIALQSDQVELKCDSGFATFSLTLGFNRTRWN